MVDITRLEKLAKEISPELEYAGARNDNAVFTRDSVELIRQLESRFRSYILDAAQGIATPALQLEKEDEDYSSKPEVNSSHVQKAYNSLFD